MDESGKSLQSSSVLGKSKLRYPLRSASKSKDEANKSPEIVTNSASFASKRGRPPSVSQSVSVLELSNKDKSDAKPPRRLSIPTRSAVTTPTSECRVRRSANGRENCDTPLSEVSRSSIRKKFNVLASASYWLSQIKLSESAGKHSISLGFFKLALEAGCETLQRLRDELKAYAQRHNLAEFAETVKTLFEGYQITESLEQLQVSETCSHAPEDSTTAPAEDILSNSSSTGKSRKLKPKSLNTDTHASSANVSAIKENAHRTRATAKLRTSVNRSSVNLDKATGGGADNSKKIQKAVKQEPKKGEDNKQVENSACAEGADKSLNMLETMEGNKENMDDLIGEVSVIEAN